MSAALTIESVPVVLLTWQCDHLGYTRCGDHVNPDRGGDTYQREARDIHREADTAGCTDAYVVEVTRAMWTCDVCKRHMVDWPTTVEHVHVVVEHPAARIF